MLLKILLFADNFYFGTYKKLIAEH